MREHKINPEKITKPIQLLAAWLIGLILVNGSFLTAATQIHLPQWAPNLLVIAAVANVPIFLISLFLLQTRFRPEMQADEFYAKYLENKYFGEKNQLNGEQKNESIKDRSEEITNKIIEVLGDEFVTRKKELETVINNVEFEQLRDKVKHSRILSEIYYRPSKFKDIVEAFKNHPSFLNDIDLLKRENIITVKNENPLNAKLTNLGKKVAHDLEQRKMLWNQNHPNIDIKA